jgi:hypothetical protein
MLKRTVFSLILAVFLSISSPPFAAQDSLDACASLVGDALALVDDMCFELGRNQVCYGHDLVDASFDGSIDEDFAAPGDIVDVIQLTSLTTSPLSVDTGSWGIALLSLQVNLPETLPGQNVTLIVFGATELVNEVSLQDQLPPPTMTAQSTGNANLRTGPGTDYGVAGTLTAGDAITLTGRNESGDWVRFELEGNSVWVYAPLLTIEGDITSLHVVEVGETAESIYTAPMQAFRLTTGIGEPACKEAPRDGLLAQTPANTTAHLQINGVEVTIGSTVFFSVPTDTILQASVIEGRVSLTAEGMTESATAGQTVQVLPQAPPNPPEAYDNDEVESVPTEVLPEPISAYWLNVPANAQWFDSGVELQAGQTFSLVATGQINLKADCVQDELAEGDTPCADYILGPGGGIIVVQEMGLTSILSTELIGALAGRVGDGAPFLVGGGGTFTAETTGTLQFGINDPTQWLHDNAGEFFVVVDVE